MPRSSLPVVLSLVAGLCGPVATLASAAPVEQRSTDGFILPVGDIFLKIEFCSESIVRVARAKDAAFFARHSVVTEPRQCTAPELSFSDTGGTLVVKSSRLSLIVHKRTGTVSFADSTGRPITAEARGGAVLTPAEVQGEKTFHVQQQWQPRPDESLYGLGQHQLGLLDIKGYDLELWQHNATVAIPFLTSSRGYGILWDNPSYTRFGDLRPLEPIPASRLFDETGRAGGLTTSYFADSVFGNLVATRTEPKVDLEVAEKEPVHSDVPAGNASVRFEGEFQTLDAGEYTFETFSNCAIKLWIDDELVADHWRQGWLAWKDVAKVRLAANRRYRVKLEWAQDQGNGVVRLLWKTPSRNRKTSLWSEVGDGIDYTFVYGPSMDEVVAGYRRVTGQAPMMPKWAFGLWQSRQRYESSKDVLAAVEGFRSRRIPFDNIVQDWFYWKADAWGSHGFDPDRFPDPTGLIRKVHEKHRAQFMISVWGKFYPGTENFLAMKQKGFLYERNLKEGIRDWVGFPYTFYDVMNPEARKLFWSQIERDLFRRGIDAWWMDATEPDLLPTPTLDGQRNYMHPTALGSGSRVLNLTPLLNSQGVYEGQRSAAPDQRVFILTRSGFAGQQRYSAAVWSGDITSTWTAMKQQIPAGLGFSLSGMPYWTLDVGGFAVPPRFSRKDATPEDVEEWRELGTRWFQMGAFLPFLRIHGEFPYREMWEFGGESHPAYAAQLEFDRLRYRLLPYLYSLAGSVTHESGTILRPLVMDFTHDQRARTVSDQFLFGPAFLVSPVTSYRARSRSVYLPSGSTWFDLWTGTSVAGGQVIDAPAPYDRIPVHVRAGSIVPVGPELQYVAEKAADPVTVYVYTGADGAFTLYEDDGLTYGYEKGELSMIPLAWDDALRTLTIGARIGSFPGMLASRRFGVVLVTKAKPVGWSFEPPVERSVTYSGEAVKLRFDR